MIDQVVATSRVEEAISRVVATTAIEGLANLWHHLSCLTQVL
jgi:hypothetical protein